MKNVYKCPDIWVVLRCYRDHVRQETVLLTAKVVVAVFLGEVVIQDVSVVAILVDL